MPLKPFSLGLLFLCVFEPVNAQQLKLRLDAGVLASSTLQYAAYIRHLSLGGGAQLHFYTSSRNVFSGGVYYLQKESRHFYPHQDWFSQTRNYVSVPLLWHRYLGQKKRFEFSLGVFGAFFFSGIQRYYYNSELTDEIKLNQPRHSRNILGYSAGFQYKIIQHHKFDLAVSYRSFGQLYGFNKPRSIGVPPNPVFVSSFFSLNIEFDLNKQ